MDPVGGLPRFEIKRTLGAGAFGIVHEAWDREHSVAVALKALSKLGAQNIYHFKNEFRTLQGIEHPNLVRLGELFGADGHWFYTMELIDGVDFVRYVCGDPPAAPLQPGELPTCSVRADHLPVDASTATVTISARPTPRARPSYPPINPIPHWFDERRLRDAARQLAEGLHALHTCGKVHRDVKASNVIVEHTGRVVILDFGLVQPIDVRDEPAQLKFAGTPSYMAPEQARGEAGPPADWYAFGVLLYRVLTGGLPFTNGTASELLQRKRQYAPLSPRSLNPEVPEDLDALCTDLLRISPTRRPSGPEILERLGAAPQAPAPSIVGGDVTAVHAFVGRHEELAALRAVFDEACATGRQVTVVIEGESGVGKSELARHFTETIRRDVPGTVVLNGRCYENETVPFKAFDGVADALSRFLLSIEDESEVATLLPASAGLLARLFPVLGRVEAIAAAAAGAPQPADPQEQRRRMFAALREVLTQIGQRFSLVIVIDDFQWADADSGSLLAEILHPGHGSELPLMLVLTQRTSSIAVSRVPGSARRIVLGSLAPREASELITLLAPDIASREAVIAETAGHPLFIVELVRHCAHAAVRLDGARLDDVLWARVQRLPPAARDLIELLSVAGAPVTQDVARHALKDEGAEFARSLSLLRVSHLARSAGTRLTDTAEPYHDRIREAVWARLTTDERKRYHARLAIALERNGADLQALVRHLEAAGESQRAGSQATRAADQAAAALAFDRAAELYETALRLGNWNEAQGRELHLKRGHALVNAGRGAEASTAFLSAADGADPATRLDCHRHAAEQLVISGRIERGLAAMADLLAEIGVREPKRPTTVLLSLLWHRFWLRVRGLRWQERHAKEVAESLLTKLDVYKAAAHGLGPVDPIRGADFQVRGLLLALDTGEPIRIARSLCVEAIFLATQGARGRRRASQLYEMAREIAERTGESYLIAFSGVSGACIDYFSGRFVDATLRLARSEEMLRELQGVTWELNGTRMFRNYALTLMGRLAELSPRFDECVRDARRRGDLHAETTFRRQAAIVWLGRDDVAGGRASLEAATWVPPTSAFHLQHWDELNARAELALYEGAVASEIEALVAALDRLDRSFLPRIETVRCVSRWLRGRLVLAEAAAGHDQRRNIRIARGVAKQLLGERVGYAMVYGHLVGAGVAVQRGSRDRAVAHLRSAIDAANAHRMVLCAASASVRLAALVGGDEGRALRDQGLAMLADEQVRDPERMIQVHAPGC